MFLQHDIYHVQVDVMTLMLTRRILVHPGFIKNYSSGFLVTSAIQESAFVNNSFGRFRISDTFFKQFSFLNSQSFCTGSVRQEKLCWEGSSQGVLLRKLELELKKHQLDEAWGTFNDLKRLFAFPEHSVVSRFITELSYSSEPYWLKKACDLVFVILKEKSDLLKPDILTKLSLSLARAQMPVPASKMLRLMLEKGNPPPMNMLWLVVLHMVKTEIGTCLASNVLIQICNQFLYLRVERSDSAKLMKPDTTIFNLVLDACVRFKSSFKGQEIMELMSQTGVVADAHSITIIAKIHEMNGQRDELKRFKDYIDQVSLPFVHHYRRYYDSLLSSHFKFDDIDAAAELVLTMNKYRDSFPDKRLRRDSQKPSLVPIGSPNIRSGLKIQIMPELLEKDSVLRVEGKEEFILFRNGKLLISSEALAKFITGYKRHGKISELSKLLLSIQKEYRSLGETILCSDVIDACIHLGWLETAHDILDDMKSAGDPMGSTTYMSLIVAYYNAKMFREAEALVRQMHKAGYINISEEMVVSACLSEVADRSGKSDLAESLIREMKEKEKAIPSMIYELNSSIYYFCKSKMIGDALTIYRRMLEMKMQPTVQTFGYLAYGYSSLEMYRDITILWGDIKRNTEAGILLLSRDLYEFILLNFLRGGYFERVMEVIGYMKQKSMYTDKWMYKSEFLKHHKNLYRSLKASNVRTEAQKKRLEYVQAFRKWAGIY
ncbi:hypothetical protein Ddye_015670 [Dipteronia dyeriana]|uniref:At1g68980-like TPR repeats domain-containing protein n=1 Tax=Dipteronia dyeriana TaxID=168575 RepID=A0AAD9WYP7_9ROSI|nr:hypothetical protein Ddye_015670 [Dipteronia dyeriana]